MDEADKILYELGYYDSDVNKKAQIQGYIDEAIEFMKGAGVPENKHSSRLAFTIKTIWAEGRDSGNPENIIVKDGMVVHLLSQLKR